MSTEILVDTVTTTTDSCQMVATETTLQVTAATKSDNQTTANEAYDQQKKQVTEMITHSDDLSPLNTFKQNGKYASLLTKLTNPLRHILKRLTHQPLFYL